MVRFTFLQKHLGTIPLSILLTNIAASAWDRPRKGHIKQTTIYQLLRSEQAVPATPLRDWRRHLTPPTVNENRSYKPAPWPTPSRRSKDFSKLEDYKPAPWPTPSRRSEEFLNLEGKDQGDAIPAADPAALFTDQRHTIPPPSMSECRFSIVCYFILKPPPTNSETASWYRPIRGQIKQVKRAKLDKAKHSASKPSIRKIMAFETSKKNRQYHDEVERAYENQPNKPLLPVYPSAMRLDTIKYGPINRLLFKNKKSGPNETCPKQAIVYLQNEQGLSGKDKRLDYLVDPIVDLMVAKGI